MPMPAQNIQVTKAISALLVITLMPKTTDTSVDKQAKEIT